MKKWLLATRPWSFTASVIPLTLGAALAWASDAAHAGLFLLTLLGGVAVQTGTNMLNIYGDYRSGVDTEASAHGESPILLGLISPEAMRRGGLIALCVAFAVGIVLGFACGWPILAFGLVGIAGGYGYTSGFWPYKYHACGPIMVFLLMGPLMALPAYYIQGGSLDWRPFLASLPIACLVTSIMHANDIRDIAHDREAGITASCCFSPHSASCHCPDCCLSCSRRDCGVRCGRSGPGLCPNPNSYRWTAYPRGTISCSGCCSLPEYCCRAALNWRRA